MRCADFAEIRNGPPANTSCGNTSSVSPSGCHLPLKGKAFVHCEFALRFTESEPISARAVNNRPYKHIRYGFPVGATLAVARNGGSPRPTGRFEPVRMHRQCTANRFPAKRSCCRKAQKVFEIFLPPPIIFFQFCNIKWRKLLFYISFLRLFVFSK